MSRFSQVFNTALQSAQTPPTLEQLLLDRNGWGRLVESAVGTHILNSSVGDGIETLYWREGNHEVDFVLQKGSKVIGIEVKSGRNKSSSGIPEFTKRFNPDKVLLVGREGIPVGEFLGVPVQDLFS